MVKNSLHLREVDLQKKRKNYFLLKMIKKLFN